MPKPIMAIVGRPNVGKSQLFNRLAGKRLSIVEDTPGVTRDRLYAESDWRGRDFTIIDTGGIEPSNDNEILQFMRFQAETAISHADVIVLITDLRTGDPIYHKCRSGDAEDVRWMEASASMPLAAKAVRIGHYSLLDGGVADSIPVRFFESLGYKRNLIILTQPKGFVKKKNPMLPAIRARYLRYPAFVAAVADRHERYNEALSYIAMQEASGKDYVIRPPIPLEIGAMERDPAQLRRVYETGRAVAENQIDKIEAFLNDVKETEE
jgi:predicted patatin/cPLA2 family phospholipase